jgi:hypothetical protein
MPLSGAPLLGIVALCGAVGAVVGLGLVVLLIVVVVVRCVVLAGTCLPLSLALSSSDPQAPSSSARAIAAADAIRFIAPHDREVNRRLGNFARKLRASGSPPASVPGHSLRHGWR